MTNAAWIAWGEVISGTETPIGIGEQGAVRCTLRVDGRAQTAVLKRIPRRKVLAEAFCSLLLQRWGLRVPTPYLVDEPTGLAFACSMLSYPNLSQRLGIETNAPGSPGHNAAITRASALAAGFPSTPLAAVADEAIGNRDRNLQNILWNGEEEWWIDHENTLGLADDMPDMNKLCLMAHATGQGDATLKTAIPLWLALDRSCPEMVKEINGIADDLSTQAAFVAERLMTLGQRLTNRFPQPDDLLFSA